MRGKAATVLVYAGLLAFPAPSGATAMEPPLGAWARGDGNARVRIQPCGSDLCAVNTWIKPGITDEKVGDRLVISIKPENEKRWSGEAFDPQRNLRFNMSFDIEKATMVSQGCVLGGILCKSMDWTRIGQE